MTYPVVPLGEVCDFVYGDGLKEIDRKGGDVPVYGSNGIVGWHDEAITKGETLIVGRKGSIGEIHFSKVPCWAIDTTYYIDKTKVPCDLTWLYYTLKALDLTRLNKSAAIPGLNREDAYEKKIILPPLTEQKRMASLLRRADRLRQLRRTAHDLGDALLQSVFLEMFGEQEKTNYLSIQDLMDSGAIIDMQDGNHGGDYPRSAEFVTEGIPFLTATNVIGNRVFLDSAPRLKPERAHKLRIGWVKPNDVLLSHNATVGRVAVMPHFEGEVVLGTSLTYYRLNAGIFLPRYFAYVFQSRHFQSQLESFMGQTTRNQVPITRQRELFVPEPPSLSKQEEFAGVVARVESLRERMGESTRQVEGLFESLLAEAFQ